MQILATLATQATSLKLSHKGWILISVPLIFELIFVATLAILLQQAEEAASREAHSRAIIGRANEISRLYYDAASSLAAHILAKGQTWDRFPAIVSKIPTEFKEFKDLARDNRQQLAFIDQLEETGNRQLQLLDKVRDAFDNHGIFIGQQVVNDTRQPLEDNFRKLVFDLQRFVDIEEAAKSNNPWMETKYRQLIKACLVVGVLFNILLAVGLAIFFNKGTAERLNILMRNTLHLSKHEPLSPVLSGSDEIAHLDMVFHRMADNLAEVERLKQEFVAMVSHDLRSPLTSLQLLLAMLSEGGYGQLSDKGQMRVTNAEQSVQRLIKLINQLLDLEKMEAGKFSMKLEDVPLTAVLKRSADSVHSFAEGQGIQIDIPVTEIVVRTDADRLVQVMVNLLSNAIKFSPPASTIDIGVEPDTNSVKVSIRDQGRGVPAKFQQQIFERFKQVEESDEREKGGTGLGLPICKAIIEGLEGTIGLESQEGKGSTFWFRIPRA